LASVIRVVGSAVIATSCGVDLRSRISMRRLSRILAGTPDVAKVSPVLMSCAPERGSNLYFAREEFCRRTLTTDTALATPNPALSEGGTVAMLAEPFRTGTKSRSRFDAWPPSGCSSETQYEVAKLLELPRPRRALDPDLPRARVARVLGSDRCSEKPFLVNGLVASVSVPSQRYGAQKRGSCQREVYCAARVLATGATGIGRRACGSGPRQCGERGAPGPEGLPGKLPIIERWTPETVFYEGDVVTHEGATFQARRDTGQMPTHSDWICLATAGRDGKCIVVRGTHNEAAEYHRLDVVALNAAASSRSRMNPAPVPALAGNC